MPVDGHWRVAGVEDDAVLVVVDIGAVLHIPIRAIKFERDNAMILPGGVIHSPGVSLVFRAEQAFRVSCHRGSSGGCDGLGIFFGLAQVDLISRVPYSVAASQCISFWMR